LLAGQIGQRQLLMIVRTVDEVDGGLRDLRTYT
jgi:hypothetical protein